MSHWRFGFSGPIICGVGASLDVGKELGLFKRKSPLIVTGPHIAETGLLDPLQRALAEAGLSPRLYLGAQINPTDEDVAAGAKCYLDNRCDSLIALGGGSRMDEAKAIRLMVSHRGKLEDYYFDVGGSSRIKDEMPPLICVPTTAGSGSEVSRGAVIIDTVERRKRLLAGPGMIANLAILDPGLSRSMPARLTAETGMDAWSHALETYVGTNFNPFAQGMSRQAVKIISTYLPKAVRNGEDIEARTQMLIGGAMGALGFAKGLGVIHSLAHQMLDIPHGLAVAILLPYGIAFNLKTVPDAYADLAVAMGLAGSNDEIASTGKCVIETIRAYAGDFGLPQRLSDVGIGRGDIDGMAAGAIKDHCHRTNPRMCTESDMRIIIERAL
jgi:alcohol dehydrogenase class IV